jgi:hypothetical protein
MLTSDIDVGQRHLGKDIYMDINMNPDTRIDMEIDIRVQCFLKPQIVHEFLHRESDTKSKILNMFFVIFVFVLPILYFCVINMQKVPSKNRLIFRLK